MFFEGGSSFVDLKNLLKQKITDQLGAGVQSSINLGAFRTINIFLLGEVEKQGVLKVNPMASVVDAILGSSGIKDSQVFASDSIESFEKYHNRSVRSFVTRR